MHNSKLKKTNANALTVTNINNTVQADPAINISDINTVKQSRAITEAKLKLAETHEIPVEWEQNIEKVIKS